MQIAIGAWPMSHDRIYKVIKCEITAAGIDKRMLRNCHYGDI